MTWAERLSKVPTDVRITFIGAACYLGSLIGLIFVGPDLFVILTGCMMLLFLIPSAIVNTRYVLTGEVVRLRIPSMVLAAICVAGFFCQAPLICIDLHVMRRIYLAGGPKAVNEWGQEWIRNYKGPRNVVVEDAEQMPPRLREHLESWLWVGGPPEPAAPILEIEMGGGFLHFGVLICPETNPPEREWWQEWIGWPSELVIYHAD